MLYRGSLGTSCLVLGTRIVSIIIGNRVLRMGSVLSLKASNDADTIFGTIFIIVWGGASVLTLNAKFLGAQM